MEEREKKWKDEKRGGKARRKAERQGGMWKGWEGGEKMGREVEELQGGRWKGKEGVESWGER